MKKLYCQYPETGVTIDMRQVFLYATPEDAHMLPQFAKEICDPKTGTKCLVKWLDPKKEIDKKDLQINLLQSQVLIVYVTTTLLSDIGKNGLPIAIQIMQKEKRPYFPVEDTPGLLDFYCELDRQKHGLSRNDIEFAIKLKGQLGKFVLDEEITKEIREKAFDSQIFMSYRKIDTPLALKLMSQIHDLPNLEAVSIWYDRFLTAGEDFNEEIFKAIDESEAFAICVTQNITGKRADEKNNFVVTDEYPYAKNHNIPIVPIKVGDSCSYEELKSAFIGIEKPVDIDLAGAKFPEIISSLTNSNSYSSERLYYLGRAYFSGYYVEQNVERAVSLLKKAAEYEDEAALGAAVFLAELYRNGNEVSIDYNKVLKYYNRALKINEKIFGKDHRYTATINNYIAMIYSELGHLDKALEHNFKALSIDEKILGTKNLETAKIYNNIGTVYNIKGQYNRALEHYHKALAKLKKDTEDSFMANVYNNIATVYNINGRYDDSLMYSRKALAVQIRVLGTEHLDTANSYVNIASVYSKLGKYDDALENSFNALKISEKLLSKDHPVTAKIYNNIAVVYLRLKKYDKTLEFSNKALVIQEKVLGTEHIDTASTYGNIACVYYNQGNLEEALKYYYETLIIQKKKLGTENPYTAI